MSNLVPLSDEVPTEARELAAELRRFFESLDISVRRYAVRCNYDPATVSRYLNGKRVPPWSFIQSLLTEVSERRGSSIQQGALEVIRRLHRSALQASNKHLYAVQTLQDQLAEADKEHKRAELREKTLLEAVEVRQHRIAELELETLELNSSLLEERDRSAILLHQLEHTAPREEELATLREEVQELKEQLARAQEQSEQAEARCEELEQQLREAEEAAGAGKDVRDQEELEAALREAAEARSLADRLREELEEVRGESKSMESRPSRPKMPKPTTPTPGELLAARAATLPVEEVAANLVKLDLADDIEEYKASLEIANSFPPAKLGTLVLALDKVSSSTARNFLLTVCTARSPEDIFILMRDYGHHTVDRDSNLASDTVNWFTRRRTWPEVRSLMNLLREAGLEELAQQCIVETGSNQGNTHLMESLRQSSAAERETLLQSVAQRRSDQKLLELVASLHESDSHLFAEVMTVISKEDPKRAKGLSQTLGALGITGRE
ncbi:helix-turn-helix domain-containing protein [Streptomyces sp. NPDC085995]|uniref:helix-turn-helix domain-containing protein n=1 Tax=Streptomyces sp. NPDC085995 TaxID=3154861 RepID=UPI00341C6B0B